MIDQFVIAENYLAGVEWYVANFTKEPPIIQNSVIVGMSKTNAHSDTTNYTNGLMTAATTGKSGLFKLDNIRIFNFGAGTVLIKTCRFCDDPLKFTNLGTELELSSISLTNVTGKMLFMIQMKRDVIYDLDGSLSNSFDGQSRASATIVHGWPHIANFNPTTCPPASVPTNWDNAVMCGPTETIRRVIFTNAVDNSLFNSIDLKATQLSAITDTVPIDLPTTNYTSVLSKFTPLKEPKEEKKQSWSLPYLTGKTYNIWWASGIDFTHMSLFTSSNFQTADQGIIFKFNYTDNRELFEVGKMAGGPKKLTTPDFFNASATHLDPATCNNGEYYHDNTAASRMMTICQSGKNRDKWEYTEVNGIMCRYLCPLPPGSFTPEDFIRDWSNATQWPGGVLPKDGDNITVNGNWTVMLDVDPAVLNNLTIDGRLVVNDTRDINITANSIFIRSGNITAGSKTNPFNHTFTIQINGNKNDAGFVIDPLVGGNKFFVVTGILDLYGKAPSSVITPLTQTAAAGSNVLHVSSNTGWVAGDELVLSPSFSVHDQHETVTIASINDTDQSITLTSNLAYTHYGASSVTVDHGHGKIDARTRVGHVNRNIKITAGPDVGWGFTTIIYGYKDENNVTRIGRANLDGVQFINGGQLDSYDASLRFYNHLGGSKSTVSATSFMGCKARCLYVKDSENIDFSNNVLYDAYQFSAQMKGITKVTYNNNLMVGVVDRPTVTVGFELSACLYVEDYVDPTTDNVEIKNNYCLGSRHHGFAVPFAKCDHFELNPIANNTAGATKIGFIINTNSQQCQAFSYAKAFGCTIGQICGSPGIQMIKFDHFVMIDNSRSVTLKLGAS